MDQIKSTRGGPRPNSGGFRPGAGRKPKAPAKLEIDAPLRVEPVNTKVETPSDPVQPKEYDSLDFLRTCMRDPSLDEKQRIRAAIALAQYEHVKRADGGKKDAVKDAAEKASGSKFAPSAPPLKLVNTH